MRPVYIINGFLESGKTEFIIYTLAQPYFRVKGKTLLLLCEEGEIEYEAALALECGAADHLHRCVHISDVLYQYEIAAGGNGKKIRDDHF